MWFDSSSLAACQSSFSMALKLSRCWRTVLIHVSRSRISQSNKVRIYYPCRLQILDSIPRRAAKDFRIHKPASTPTPAKCIVILFSLMMIQTAFMVHTQCWNNCDGFIFKGKVFVIKRCKGFLPIFWNTSEVFVGEPPFEFWTPFEHYCWFFIFESLGDIG